MSKGRKPKIAAAGDRRPDRDTVLLRADLELSADAKAPTELRILHAGLNYTDRAAGAWDAGPYMFDDLAAALVMANYEADASKGASKRRLQIDWNHGMLDPDADRHRGASAGSFVPVVKAGPELWASDIQWNDEGRADVEGRVYNYVSPALRFEYGDDGNIRPRLLVNFALVNMAGLLEADQLLAASAAITRQQHQETTEMDEKLEAELRTRIATLETENKALRSASSDVVALRSAVGARADAPNAESVAAVTGLVALRSSVLKLTGQDSAEGAIAALQAMKTNADKVVTLEAQIESDKTAALRAELDGVWEGAKKAGKLPPADQAEVEASLTGLTGGKVTAGVVAAAKTYVAKLSAVVSMTPTKQPAGGVSLSPERIAIAKQMGRDIKAIQEFESKRLSEQA